MKYVLKCLKTNEEISDDYTLHHTDNSLLQAQYDSAITIHNEAKGVWRFVDWLPVTQPNRYTAGTLTYKAEQLGKALGLSDLWVTFHGHWPERGGLCPTGSFKDMEAVPTIQRLQDHNGRGLICASAGNTARAFTHFCGASDTPLIVVVGKEHAHRIWVRKEHPTESVRLVVVEDGDYADAKKVAKGISAQLPGWQMEGGVHNVARRDGIGSLIIDAAYAIGRLPDHYFQGVGGGPGPIGVHEMAERLIRSGEFSGPVPRQHLSQNVEHCPIHNAWQAGRNHLIPKDYPATEVAVYSDYLLNKGPAYGLTGALYDILKASNGQTHVVTRDDAMTCKRLFEETEGIDIMTPGAVALSSVQQALAQGDIRPSDCVVLNISGGGVERLRDGHATRVVEPWLRVTVADGVQQILKRLALDESGQ